MHFLRLCILGVLLTAIRLSAEVILPENWTLAVKHNRAVSSYTELEPLSNFADARGNTIFLKHPDFGIKCFAGNSKPRPGILRISFTASALTSAPAHAVVKVTMYGYHFSNDNCTGKAGELFWEKDFSVSGKKALAMDFNITPEQLKCIFCDEQVPSYRFFTSIFLKDKSSGIALTDINISAPEPLAVWGKKQIHATNWLLDELKSDKAKDAGRAALKKELETPPPAPVKLPPQPVPVKKVEPVEVAIPLEKFFTLIDADFPALFDAEFRNGQLIFDKKPANRPLVITLCLAPPPIPENFEYVLVIDRNFGKLGGRIYDKNDRPLDKNGGYLPDGTPIMRLPHNCRKIVFEAYSSNTISHTVKRAFYREIKKKK